MAHSLLQTCASGVRIRFNVAGLLSSPTRNRHLGTSARVVEGGPDVVLATLLNLRKIRFPDLLCTLDLVDDVKWVTLTLVGVAYFLADLVNRTT